MYKGGVSCREMMNEESEALSTVPPLYKKYYDPITPNSPDNSTVVAPFCYSNHMPLTAAEKMQNLREKRKNAGLCVVCGQRRARKARVTCQQCADRAKKLVQKSRERAK